jgi:hypothetical protein
MKKVCSVKGFIQVIKCYKCGESKYTLHRIVEDGKKVKPAKYICSRCRV